MNKKILFLIVWGIIGLCLISAIICYAAAITSDPYDGTGWNTAAPNDEALYGQAYLELQDLRKGVATRSNKEHVTYASSSAGGNHLNGSAVCYEGTTAEPNLPDDSAALSDIARDRGRLWLDDNFDPPLLKRWDGSAWEAIGTLAGGTTSAVYLHNTTHEDTERGRESQIRTFGEQSGGEKSTLGYIEFSHDGTADDQKGRFVVVLNDSDDANTPSKIPIVYQSDGTIDVGDSLSVVDEDNMVSNSAARVPTQQSVKAYVDTNTTDVKETDVSGTSWVLDEDALTSDSNDKVPTQQSVKAYVDTKIAAVMPQFGSWTANDSNSLALAKDGVYRATSDGMVCAIVTTNGVAGGYTNSTNPPTTLRAQCDLAAGNQVGSITFPVKKNEFFKIAGVSGSPTVTAIYWLPFGSGDCRKQ